MLRRLLLPAWIALAGLCVLAPTLLAEVTIEKSEQGVVIKADGQPFAEYVVESGGKPIVWPIIGPTGKPMTRAYPMRDDVASEKHDHPHHRSLWFTHGDVNGLSFWDKDTTRHREFVKLESGRQGLVVTRNDWIDREGKTVLEDERRLTFGADASSRWIDFDITLTARGGPVTFGDTKEGSFGVRVPGTMKVDAKLGGRIVDSKGRENQAAWGKQAEWVDYYGPVDGETLGIAIMNHPTSFRFPTFWHVRTYGLFAANPFGIGDFTGSKDNDGSYKLDDGKSITFRYRVLFHKGDEKQGRVADNYAAYVAQSPD